MPLVPNELREMLKKGEITLDPIIDVLVLLGIMNGVGRHEKITYRYEGADECYFKSICRNVHCLPLELGDFAAACEAVMEREFSNLDYKLLGEETYEITARPAEFPEEFIGRLEWKGYEHSDGDIEFEPCESCGAPKDLAFKWYPEEGIIINTRNGRGKAFLSPRALETLFGGMEKGRGG